ncbi:MAG TPA: hypothetical protein VHW00_00475 [Thermoanaerobaculia bacterium]|nr:hypothetical protein [Thermoanaerobaculia bacterium]
MTLLLAAFLLLSPLDDGGNPRAFQLPKKKEVVKKVEQPRPATDDAGRSAGFQPAVPPASSRQEEIPGQAGSLPTGRQDAGATNAGATDAGATDPRAFQLPAAPTPPAEEKTAQPAAPKGVAPASFTLPNQPAKPKKTGKKQPVTFQLPEKKP